MGNVPTCVGVPERTPLVASVRPLGSVPLNRVKVAVPIAPTCVKVWLNAVPAVPVLTAGLMTMMVLQQTGSAGSPAGSDGAAGEQTPVVCAGKVPTGGPMVGKVEPARLMVPQAVRVIAP